ncbi:unnamed protein product [Prorocentrum cordatum]|uniref:PDZ domain-containing protein n=1 Tax=Prorocentrum cordatum TaxID=2364126 RepID=A0ABN9S8K6_9DINO|nr:unnamed protein product [Polarella glacialis]
MGCTPSAPANSGRAIEQEVLQGRHVRSPAGAPGRELPEQFTIRLHKGAGEALGVSLGILPTGAVLYCLEEGYVLDKWNKENPDAAVRPGFVIEQVNGVSGYWPLMEEMRREGPLEARVSTVPPQSAGPNWLEDIATMGRNIELSNDKSPFMVRLSAEASQNEKALTSFPSVVACAAGLDKCAICLEDFDPNDMLTELPKLLLYPKLPTTNLLYPKLPTTNLLAKKLSPSFMLYPLGLPTVPIVVQRWTCPKLTTL